MIAFRQLGCCLRCAYRADFIIGEQHENCVAGDIRDAFGVLHVALRLHAACRRGRALWHRSCSLLLLRRFASPLALLKR